MTARERIQKSIKEHDIAIEWARIRIDEATGRDINTFGGPDAAYRAAKIIMKQCGIIFSRLAQRREAVSNLELLDYHATKNPQAANDVGL